MRFAGVFSLSGRASETEEKVRTHFATEASVETYILVVVKK